MGRLFIACVFFPVLLFPLLAYGWGFGGEKTIAPGDHTPHKQDTMYYMEQWSSTIYFGKNHNININLIHSALTTKSDKAIFRVEYNNPNGGNLKEEKRCTIRFQKNPFALVCGNGAIAGSPEDLKFQFQGKKVKMVANVKALAPPWRPGDGRLRSADNRKDFYDFMLIVPRGRAKVKINGEVLSGNAVVDHSYTNAGHHKVSLQWFRTTYIDDEISIIFAGNRLKNGRSTGWVSITDKEGRTYSSAAVNTVLGNFRKDGKKKHYSYPRSVTIKGKGDGFELSMPNLRLKGRRDMLGHMSTVEKFVVRKFTDPMRYSLGGNATITWPAAMERPTVLRELTVIFKQLNE